MTIYYQHIGRELWKRDGPRSIGTVADGVMRFSSDDIDLNGVPAQERDEIKRKVDRSPDGGVQVWGLPSGARRVLRDMSEGDELLLLESEDFRYVGTVVHYLSEPSWELSAHIWGEQRFPLIVLLDGALIRYPWSDFVREFGFAPNYHMRGNTMKLSAAKVAGSSFGDERRFIEHLVRECAS